VIKTSNKLDVLRCIFSNKPVKYILEGLDFMDLVEIRKFAWEKTLELGVINKGASFSKTDIARHVKPLRKKDPVQDIQLEEAKYQIKSICEVAREYV
jgi:hypothetical protein